MNKEEGFDNYMSRLLSPCKNCAAKDAEIAALKEKIGELTRETPLNIAYRIM